GAAAAKARAPAKPASADAGAHVDEGIPAEGDVPAANAPSSARAAELDRDGGGQLAATVECDGCQGRAEGGGVAPGGVAGPGADHNDVGPSCNDVAAKYKGKDVEATLVEKVKHGGAGVWGQVPMPPNPQVPDADLHAIVKWILTLK